MKSFYQFMTQMDEALGILRNAQIKPDQAEKLESELAQTLQPVEYLQNAHADVKMHAIRIFTKWLYNPEPQQSPMGKSAARILSMMGKSPSLQRTAPSEISQGERI